MTITQFTMEEVRCFAGRQAFEIRPLTFLVGENSTGKTTALACFQVLAEYLSNGEIDFNFHPYSMGIFREIVRRSKRTEKSFSLGLSLDDTGGNIEFAAKFSEKEGGFEPVISTATVGFDDGEVVFEYGKVLSGENERIRFHKEGRTFRVALSNAFFMSGRPPFALLSSLRWGGIEGQSEDRMRLARYLEEKYKNNKFLPTWGTIDIDKLNVFSSAPVRSQPQRTYNPTREYYDPEGSDVPMRLSRIKTATQDEWEYLKEMLDRFGESSGLFQSIDVKNLGRSMGAPFQLTVKVRGPTTNIVDVGYGVSQILPILVHILEYAVTLGHLSGKERKAHFLLQQPEVHLHPKAQAELSSLLAHLASRGSQSFIVETHSDYMIDRARIEIMKGNIDKGDVSLIYLEPKKNIVNVHNISFDEMGNMIGVPPHFREFFLHESSRLMGFED